MMANSGKSESPTLSPIRLLVAGAGTGGHLFPGIAVAQVISGRAPDSRVLFVTTGRAIETTVLAKHAYETAPIVAAGIKGKSLFDKVKSLAILPRGFAASVKILREFRPLVVIGMGGYSSGPLIVAAWLMGIPCVIHEQNRLPGITNRMLGCFASRIYVSFADTVIGGEVGKIRFTGNPVRAEIRDCRSDREKTLERHGIMTVLILGGSQGAHSINMAMIDSLDHLENPGKFRFIHQTGAGDADRVRAAYEQKGVSAVVAAFFEDMAALYGQADLAICRAGASTIAELAATCVPAVFIPFPFAADNHQVANAEGLVAAGAARMLLEPEMTGGELARQLEGFLSEREAIDGMKAAMGKMMATGDAAEAIADDIFELIGFNK